jgi:toxin-antitoxin system PIN domain toxin
MFLVDTNILIYAVHRESPDHQRAAAAIRTWQHDRESWFTTWPILYEFLRVTTHPRVFDQPLTFELASRFVAKLFTAESFDVLTETTRHSAVVQELAGDVPWARGSVMHDLHTVALMREHGVPEIRTADTGFHRFRGLRVVNPLVA